MAMVKLKNQYPDAYKKLVGEKWQSFTLWA
jgi:hypothetical protein